MSLNPRESSDKSICPIRPISLIRLADTPETFAQNTWRGTQIQGGEPMHGGEPTHMVAWSALVGRGGTPPCVWAPHHARVPHHVAGIQVSRYPGLQVSRYPGVQISRYQLSDTRYQIPDIRYHKKKYKSVFFKSDKFQRIARFEAGTP